MADNQIYTPPQVPKVGGTFAPPLTDKLMKDYKAFVDALQAGPVKDALLLLYAVCAKWWDLPEPSKTEKGKAQPHPVGRGLMVPLKQQHQEALDNLIPWAHELTAIQSLLDSIPPEEKDTRHVAFHLLWHVKELDLGREPMTSDLI